MIIKYWVDLHKFGYAPLYVKGKIFKKVASVAVPIAVMAIPGLNVVAAGAIGGGLSGLISGGGIKGALVGGLTGGVTAGIASGAFKGAFAPGGAFGGQLAGAVPQGGAAAGRAGMSSMIGAQTSNVVGASNIAKGLVARGAQTAGQGAGYGAMFGVAAQRPITAAPGVTTGGSLNLGRDAMFQRTQDAQAKFLASTGVGAPTTSKATPSLGATEGSSKILGFDKSKMKEIIGAGMSAYEGEVRQSQLDALQQNLAQYKSEHADFYAQHAKEKIAALERGELPEAYKAVFDKEEERLTRLMIAQGHNPAEAGHGAETVVRGIADMKAGFINQEKQFYAAMAGGAEGMQSRIQQLQFEEANKRDKGLKGLSELGTSVAGAILGDDKQDSQTLQLKIV